MPLLVPAIPDNTLLFTMALSSAPHVPMPAQNVVFLIPKLLQLRLSLALSAVQAMNSLIPRNVSPNAAKVNISMQPLQVVLAALLLAPSVPPH